MIEPMKRLTMGTPGRIIDLLRRNPSTVDQLAQALGLTPTAIRSQLATLERDGMVERRGSRRGTSKPSRLYTVTPEAELLFARAYVPILTQLLHVLAHRVSRKEFDTLMREVGRGTMAGRPVPRGSTEERVVAAKDLVNELGGLAEVERTNGTYMIRGKGCPLRAATTKYPEACNALESMLSEFVGLPVIKCCERTNRVECCFEIAADPPNDVPKQGRQRTK
jgi:predicted ArsR family transcriptional regulator